MAQEAMTLLEAAQVWTGRLTSVVVVMQLQWGSAIRLGRLPSAHNVHSSTCPVQAEIGTLQAAKAAAEQELAELQQLVGRVAGRRCAWQHVPGLLFSCQWAHCLLLLPVAWNRAVKQTLALPPLARAVAGLPDQQQVEGGAGGEEGGGLGRPPQGGVQVRLRGRGSEGGGPVRLFMPLALMELPLPEAACAAAPSCPVAHNGCLACPHAGAWRSRCCWRSARSARRTNSRWVW